MTILFEDGFETADVSLWDGTVITTGEKVEVVTPGIHGKYAILCSSASAGPDQYATVTKTMTPAATMLNARGYFAVKGGLPLPTDGDRINLIIFLNYACNVAITRVNGVDQFQLRVWNETTRTWVVANSGISPQINKVYCVELEWRANQTAKLYIDGKLAGQVDIAGINDNTISTVRFGLGVTVTAGHTGLSVLCDTCAIGDAYIGPYQPVTPQIPILPLLIVGALVLIASGKVGR